MSTRKKWRIVYPGHVGQFLSEKAAYEFVDRLRSAWAAGGPTGSLTVQVDEGLGFGWQDSEYINFAEETS